MKKPIGAFRYLLRKRLKRDMKLVRDIQNTPLEEQILSFVPCLQVIKSTIPYGKAQVFKI